jgi:ankyrin repeat protein
LARLLLERGANPNDSQTLYNRQFRSDNAHLELLFEFGLGQGDAGLWQERMAGAIATIPQMLERQMSWALRHDMSERVHLLRSRGVPLGTPQSPTAELDELIALAATDVTAAVALRPALLVQAVALGRKEDARRLVEVGWHVDAMGRADVFSDEPWQTALHTAVERNSLEMVELLLSLGADPSIKDARFHATPKEWAEHFGHAEVAALF